MAKKKGSAVRRAPVPSPVTIEAHAGELVKACAEQLARRTAVEQADAERHRAKGKAQLQQAGYPPGKFFAFGEARTNQNFSWRTPGPMPVKVTAAPAASTYWQNSPTPAQRQVPLGPRRTEELMRQASPLHQVVLLKNVPNGLCTRSMMDAVLQQAGFEDDVVSVDARKTVGERFGQVRLTMTSQFKADLCVRHFGGRAWDNNEGHRTKTIPIQACFEERRETSPQDMSQDVEAFASSVTTAADHLMQTVLNFLTEPTPGEATSGRGRRKGRGMPMGLDSSHFVPPAVIKPSVSEQKDMKQSSNERCDSDSPSVATAEGTLEVESDRSSEDTTD